MSTNLHYLRLYVTQGMKLMWRSKLLSVIMGLVVGLLLFAVYVMVAASEHTREAARKVDDQLVVTAIIKQDDTRYRSVVDAERLAVQVRALPHVKKVHVVTEQETRDRFVRNFTGLRSAPATWVFQEALEISVTDTAKMSEVRDRVARMRGVEQATYLEELVKKLTAVSGYLQRMAFGGAMLLAVIAAFVVMLTVRSAMDAEKRSVQTMASVGGSAWTIIAPLLVHLLTVTTIASVVACVAGWWADPKIGTSLSDGLSNLPEWLRTGRAYGLMELWPLLAGVAGAAVTVIVCTVTWRQVRGAGR